MLETVKENAASNAAKLEDWVSGYMYSFWLSGGLQRELHIVYYIKLKRRKGESEFVLLPSIFQLNEMLTQMVSPCIWTPPTNLITATPWKSYQSFQMAMSDLTLGAIERSTPTISEDTYILKCSTVITNTLIFDKQVQL